MKFVSVHPEQDTGSLSKFDFSPFWKTTYFDVTLILFPPSNTMYTDQPPNKALFVLLNAYIQFQLESG